MNGGQQETKEPAEGDAKEAIKELILELNNALAEKDIAVEGLAMTQKEMQVLKEDYSHRELEIIALESSLHKALALTANDGTNELDKEIRVVIGELVEEIARIKTNTTNNRTSDEGDLDSRARQKIDQLSKNLKIADKTADLEAERADIAEKKIQNILNFVRKYPTDLEHENGQPHNEAVALNKIVSTVLDMIGTSDSENSNRCSSPIFSVSDGSDDEIDNGNHQMHDNEDQENKENVEKSFAEELEHMLSQSENVMGNALADFDNEFKSDYALDDSEGYEAVMVDKRNSVHVVQYHVYESLRRKCDMLEAEREDLLNETLALMDSSAAASAAEIEARVKMVEREAAWRLEEHKREAEHHLASVTEEFTMRLAASTHKS